MYYEIGHTTYIFLGILGQFRPVVFGIHYVQCPVDTEVVAVMYGANNTLSLIRIFNNQPFTQLSISLWQLVE
jgi:hypothetical protein